MLGTAVVRPNRSSAGHRPIALAGDRSSRSDRPRFSSKTSTKTEFPQPVRSVPMVSASEDRGERVSVTLPGRSTLRRRSATCRAPAGRRSAVVVTDLEGQHAVAVDEVDESMFLVDVVLTQVGGILVKDMQTRR